MITVAYTCRYYGADMVPATGITIDHFREGLKLEYQISGYETKSPRPQVRPMNKPGKKPLFSLGDPRQVFR